MAYYCKTLTVEELLSKFGLVSANENEIVTRDVNVTRRFLDFETKYLLNIKIINKTVVSSVILDLIDSIAPIKATSETNELVAFVDNANILTEILKEKVTLPYEIFD